NQADAVAKPSMDDIEDVIAKLREQLTDLASQEIILFTDKIEKGRSVLAVLGCLQIAASQLDKLTIEHRQGDKV
ncbi:MAG: hypothetical protein WBC91_10225, partial [Phototrophicaceae bacterium]